MLVAKVRICGLLLLEAQTQVGEKAAAREAIRGSHKKSRSTCGEIFEVIIVFIARSMPIGFCAIALVKRL